MNRPALDAIVFTEGDPTMNPQLCVNQRSSQSWSLDEDLDFFKRVGIEAIALDLDKLTTADAADTDAVVKRLKAADIRITDLRISCPFDLAHPEMWPDQREQASMIMDLALELRPDVMTFTTGSPGTVPWERIADSFAEAMHQILMEADREDLRVSIEHNDPMLVDTGFIHTLRDAIDMSWRIDSGVTMVIDSCWSERNLAGTIAAGVEQISLVRVGDRSIGGRLAGTSLVPGDGDIPLARIIGQLLDAGYAGYFDIMIGGPEIEQEGYESAIRRSLRYLEEVLEDSDETDFDES